MRVKNLLVLLMMSLVLVQCSSDNRGRPKAREYHQLHALNDLLMNEVRRKRVVMLGDSYPGHITYSRLVVSFLNFWVDRLIQSPPDTTLPGKLALALEMGHTGEQTLNDYLRTGDRYYLMRSLIDEQLKYESDEYRTRHLSVDFLEFCEELWLISKRIDSLNLHNPATSFSLDIIGPEADPPYSYTDVRTKNRQEFNATKMQWDASERDQECSSRLEDYMTKHPDHRVLVFSKMSHMIRDIKSGYYLARDLDSLIGRGNVSVFQTYRISFNPASRPQIEEFSHEGETPDFLVRKPTSPPYPFPFFAVRSRNTFRALIDLAEHYDTRADTLERKLARTMLSKALGLLRRSHVALDPRCSLEIAALEQTVAAATAKAILAPDLFSHIRRLADRFDAVKDVLAIDSVMATFTPSTEFYNDLTTVLDNLPGSSTFVPETPRVTPMPDVDSIKAGWARMWKEKKNERVTYMLLQVLWLGTPTETREAMEVLKRRTGRDYETPEAWDAWWRQSKWTN